MHMVRWLVGLGVALVFAGCGGGDSSPAITPTVTASATATSTSTATATASATATLTVTPTATSTPTLTSTSTATATPTSTLTSTPSLSPTPAAVTALFHLDPLDLANPFPSDRRRDEQGQLLVSGPLLSSFLPADAQYDGARNYLARAAADLSRLDGYSTFGPLRVLLDGPAGVPDGVDPDGIYLMQLEAPFARVPVQVRSTTPESAGDYAIEILPRLPLAPRTTYAFAVTRAVRDSLGRPLQPSAAFRNSLCNGIESATVAAWRARLDPLREHLESTDGLVCEDFVMLDFLTTQTTMDDLLAIRDLFDTGALPIATPSFDSTAVAGVRTGVFRAGTPEFDEVLQALSAGGGVPDGASLGAIVVGTFPSFEFRGGNRSFDPARVAGTAVPPVNPLAFYMAFPAAPPPPEGYPLVMYGHGLSRNGGDAVTTATSYPDLPMVWAGISAVSHGHRGNFLSFFNLNNVLATRDSFRQTVADFLQFQRMLRHSDAPELAQLDRSRFHYYGISLGGIMGALYLGIEPDIEVAMLSVPGGGLPNILTGSEFIGELLQPLISFALGIGVDDPLFPLVLGRFTQVAQWVLDPGDPINTAPYLLGPTTLRGGTPKKLLMQMGISDTIVPNRTSEDLARAARLPDLKANLGCASSEGCSGIWRFVMTEYEQPSDCGHLISFTVPEAHQQSIRFLFSNGTLVEDASPRLTPAERPECPDLSGGIPN